MNSEYLQTRGRTGRFLCSPLLLALVVVVVLGGGAALYWRRAFQSRRLVPPVSGYVDVAAAAGIRFRHHDGRRGVSTMMEQIGPGCALLDYDGDGWPDIYLLNGRDRNARGIPLRNALYHNNRDGTFTDVTAKARAPGTGYALGVAVGDYDNDGYPDIYICQYGKNVLYHNNGNGTFTDVTARAHVDGMDAGEPFHTGAAWIDYDRDGRLDLFVCTYVNFEAGPRYCDDPAYDGMPRVPHGCPPTRYPATHCILYHNNGDGTFTNVTKRAGLGGLSGKSLGVVTGDYNNDGWPDLYVANDSMPGFLLRNNHNGTFTDVGIQSGVAFAGTGEVMSGMGVDFGDYQNNGRLSLFVADYQDKPDHLFENLGGGRFCEAPVAAGLAIPSIPLLGFGGGFLDYNNDGWKDIFVANGHVVPEIDTIPGKHVHYRQPSQLFRNNGNGTFTDVSASAGPAFQESGAGRGAAWGDIWNRGVQDILVANNSGPPILMKNLFPCRNHFLSLRLVGTRSNRDAIGARAYVTAGGIRQMQEVKSACGYLSCGDLRLHFGLGKARIVERIEVEWPSASKPAFFKHVAADRFYQVKEGTPTLQPQPIARGRRS
ncbi:MAG TPA: CRTAC1 family protein [Armatimonadota bacterium]|nr:CRTAC1 family protein [Armatimonadota bacterium]